MISKAAPLLRPGCRSKALGRNLRTGSAARRCFPEYAHRLCAAENAAIRSFHAGFRLGTCQDAYAKHGHPADLALKAIPARNEKRAGRGPGEGGFESGSYQLSASPGRVLCFLSWRNKKGRPPAGVGEHLPPPQHITRTRRGMTSQAKIKDFCRLSFQESQGRPCGPQAVSSRQAC